MRAGGARARLARLRDVMREHGVAAYLVPSSDPHQSEYVPDHWARRQWVSGFTGSAGDLVVGLAGGGLWTDGRYHLQARQQLRGTGIRLFPVGEKDVPTLEKHLAKNPSEGVRGRGGPRGPRHAARAPDREDPRARRGGPEAHRRESRGRGARPGAGPARAPPRRAPSHPLRGRVERVQAPAGAQRHAPARGGGPRRHHPRRDRLAVQRARLRRRLQPGGHRVRGGDPGRGGPARRPGQAGPRGGGPSSPHRPGRALRRHPPHPARSRAAQGGGVDRYGDDEPHVRAPPRRGEADLRAVADPAHEGAQERGGNSPASAPPTGATGRPWCASSAGWSGPCRRAGSPR